MRIRQSELPDDGADSAVADRIVASELDGGTGEKEQRGSVSLLRGPRPEVRVLDTAGAEAETIRVWIREMVASGVKPGEIAIFARTDQDLRRIAEPALRQEGLSFRALKDDEPFSDCVSLGTMHRQKDLSSKPSLLRAEMTGRCRLTRYSPDGPTRWIELSLSTGSGSCYT